MADRYAIAPNGVFPTVQGEGAMLGVPTLFVRLAGCSVGCAGCDTDYRVSERLTAAEVVGRLRRLPRLEWVWLTGGEPTDHPLGELVRALGAEYRVALATAGVRAETRDGWAVRDKQGRRRGAWYATGEYRVCAEQPDDETLRDTAKWRAWCVEQNNRKEVEAP